MIDSSQVNHESLSAQTKLGHHNVCGMEARNKQNWTTWHGACEGDTGTLPSAAAGLAAGDWERTSRTTP